ncbi:MAG TPA: hemolysin III family protein [Polyangiaceae bacterium]
MAISGDAQKPRLRGVLHQVAFVLASVATAALIWMARPGLQRRSTVVFGASLVALFAVSALYHRVSWRPRALSFMRRLDHSAVVVAIAGGYTPLLALVPSARGGHAALAVMWIAAGIGVARAFAWPRAPTWVAASLCVAIGWVGSGEVIDRVPAAGASTIAAFVASGLLYTLGAVVYATRRPDPVPHVFGYHEVFHALVVLGTALLFGHVALVLRAGQ